MSLDYSSWPKFGGKPISRDLVAPLNQIPSNTLRLLKANVTQGAGDDVSASNGTHRGGFALDFRTRNLSNAQVREMVLALQAVGFAAVLRLVGDDLGTSINRVEHIHAALMGYSNSRAVAALTGPTGRNFIERKLAARGKK